ncbi:MAG: hypothetical protein U0931_37245 [Vulcanimicrobiota bacterium]
MKQLQQEGAKFRECREDYSGGIGLFGIESRRSYVTCHEVSAGSVLGYFNSTYNNGVTIVPDAHGKDMTNPSNEAIYLSGPPAVQRYLDWRHGTPVTPSWETESLKAHFPGISDAMLFNKVESLWRGEPITITKAGREFTLYTQGDLQHFEALYGENRGQLELSQDKADALRFLDAFKTPGGQPGTGAEGHRKFDSIHAWRTLESPSPGFYQVFPRPGFMLLSVHVKSWDDLLDVRRRAENQLLKDSGQKPLGPTLDTDNPLLTNLWSERLPSRDPFYAQKQ